MTLMRLALQSFRHYRWTHAAVAFGVAAAVAVMAGALLVGHSVRASLASITTSRLGRTGLVVGAETPFTEALGGRMRDALGLGPNDAAPVLQLQGLARHESSGLRAGKVDVYGVDARFFAFHGVEIAPPAGSDVLLSPDLAAELGAAERDTVIVRVARPTDIPLDSLHGRKDDTGRSLRMTTRETLPRESMGAFSLSAEQGPVRAVFVPLDRLQRDLDLDTGASPRVNTLLFAPAGAGGTTATEVRRALIETMTADDIGVSFTAHPEQGIVLVESASGLITEPLRQSVETMAAREGLAATPVLTWLANRVTVNGRAAPYSLVSAIGPDAGGDARLAPLLTPADPTAATAPPIVFNDWLTRDLQPSPGDAVEIEYYRWADEGRLVEDRATFTFAGSVPIQGLAADRRLAPDYPGISDSDNLGDWDPPFPIDLSNVRPIDEEYWDEYRATPKAFVALETGQELWRTRYGQTSSLRLRPVEAVAGATSSTAQETDLAALAQQLRQALPQSIDPGRAGIGVADVRTQNLAASVGATDFGAYFFYFSFFLVVSAIILAALFFRLSVEQRLPEIGLLRAEGFSLGMVRRVFLIEGAIVSVAGAVAGVVLAIAWAALMMYGLRTWWVGAVGTTLLTLHVDTLSLVIGAAGGAIAGLGSIALTIRRLSRQSPRSLLVGEIAAAAGAGRTARSRSALLSGICFLLAVALSAVSLAGVIPAAGGFFGAGALALVGGLAAFRRWLGRVPAGGALAGRGTGGLIRFGLHNASWRPGRSLTAAALVAAAVFLLVSVDTFRKDTRGATGRSSGTGGFALIAEAALPIVHDVATPEGREATGLELPPGEPELDGVSFVSARLRPGDDASCLNLFQPKQPRVVGVPQSLAEANRFSFAASLADTDAEAGNPWRLLGPPDVGGVVPAIVDATSLQYVFHASVGDVLTIDVETTHPVELRVVGTLSDSMLQGEILIAEEAFQAVYPDVEGYRILLVDVETGTPERVDEVARFIEDRLEPFGVDAQDGVRRLEAYHRVENTYLSTFQTLGGLGLVLGSFGLAAIVARNVLERRRELALLGAAGYTGGEVQTVVVAEHLALVAAGLIAGLVAALIAIAPVLLDRGGGLPSLPLVWIAIVAVTGLVASLAATRGVRRMPLVPSLRSE